MKNIKTKSFAFLFLLSMGSAQAEPITCAWKNSKVGNVVFEKAENLQDHVFVKKFNQWTETGFYTHPVEAKLEFKDETYECEMKSSRLEDFMECGPFKFTVEEDDNKFDFYSKYSDTPSKYNLIHPHWAKWATHETENDEGENNLQNYLVLNINNPARYVSGKHLNYQLSPNLERCKKSESIPSGDIREGYMCIEEVVCEDGVSKTKISQDILLVHPRIAKVLKKLFSDKYGYLPKGIYSDNRRNWKQGNDEMTAYLNKHQKGIDNPYNLVMKLTVTSNAPFRLEKKEESPL